MKSVILVTGASTGIGHLTSRALAAGGHTVYASMRDIRGRNAAHVRELRDWSFAHGHDLRAVELDVLSQESADAGRTQVLKFVGGKHESIHAAAAQPFRSTTRFTSGTSGDPIGRLWIPVRPEGSEQRKSGRPRTPAPGRHESLP